MPNQTPTSLLHQAYQAMPQMDVPFLDPSGKINPMWYFFFWNLWVKCGGSNSTMAGAAYLSTESGGLEVYQGNQMLGGVPIPGTPPGDVIGFQALMEMTPQDQQQVDQLGGQVLAVPQDFYLADSLHNFALAQPMPLAAGET